MKNDKSFLLPHGIKLRKHSLEEGYSIEEGPDERRLLLINMSADHMADGLARLFDALEYPGFLILEIPANRRQEEELAAQGDSKFHLNVYYWDGLEKEGAQEIFQKYGVLLINDGISNFGFGSHMNKEEVFVGRYKTIHLWTATPEKFQFILRGMGIERRDGLATLGSFINRRNPCDTSSIKVNGISIYDLVEQLQPEGLYLAKTEQD